MGSFCSTPTKQVAAGTPSQTQTKPADAAQPTTKVATTATAPITVEGGDAGDVGALVQYLRKVPILSNLTDADRRLLAKELHQRRYSPDQEIVTEGQPGTEFFILQSGAAVVTRKDLGSGDAVTVATLTDGDYFGEAALINNDLRQASVLATAPSSCLVLDASAFQRLFGKSKLNVQFAKRNAISAENLRQDTVSPHSAEREFDKSAETMALIESALASNVLFSALDSWQIKQIMAEMYKVVVPASSQIIKQGDRGDYFYVVEKGQFDVVIAKAGASESVVATRGPGTSFGELALMYDSPRAASVMAKSEGVVWAVSRNTFRRILMQVSDEKRRDYENFLKSVPLLSALTASERAAAAEAMEETTFTDGVRIVEQGQDGETFYVILSGNVDVSIKEGDKLPKVVQHLGKGEFFGERALLKSEPRAATVIASGPVTCLTLDRQAFSIVLGPLTEIMQRKIENYSSDVGEGDRREPRIENPLMEMKMSDLHILGTLGRGSFGHVQLVKHLSSGETFAMKKISKAQIVQLGQQEHIMSEKKVMSQLNHPFLIRLRATLKDRDFVYFVIELCLGGELFSVLRARGQFDERKARFYAGSVVLAFEYMHNHDIIYRDLKPENLLLDNKGFLKVTDFGFAKYVPDRTWTLCGTPDYLAPEVISGQGHGKAVDWWTLGVLIYEMLVSYPPFYDTDPMKTYAKIIHGHVSFPKHVNKDAVDLIQRLLHPKAAKRLGAVKGGAKLIKKHPWFKGFDWDALIAKTMTPPIIPTVKSNVDMGNFEDYGHQEDNNTPYKDDGLNWDADF